MRLRFYHGSDHLWWFDKAQDSRLHLVYRSRFSNDYSLMLESIQEMFAKMSEYLWQEKLIEQKVTYTLLKDGKFYIIENVPARVDLETGEQLFSPQTVEKLHQLILGHYKPVRMIQTLVYEFA